MGGRWHTARIAATSASLGLVALLAFAAGTPPVVSEASTAPEAPESVTVTRSDGAVHASWPAVEGATSYHVTYSINGGRSWLLAALHHPDASITISPAINEWTYVVGVRARNDAGDSGWTNSPPAPPYVPPPPPDAVSSVTVTRADGSLTATWPAVEGATSYHITYSADHGASWSLGALNHPGTEITIEGVDNAETYLVGVRARNADGDSGWTNSPPAGPYEAAKPAAVPAVPGGLTALPGVDSVILTWDAADAGDAVTGYEYQMRVIPADEGEPASEWGAWTAIADSGAETAVHIVEDLTKGDEYRFRLRALNAAGASDPAPAGDPDYVAATPEAGARAANHTDYDEDDDGLIDDHQARAAVGDRLRRRRRRDAVGEHRRGQRLQCGLLPRRVGDGLPRSRAAPDTNCGLTWTSTMTLSYKNATKYKPRVDDRDGELQPGMVGDRQHHGYDERLSGDHPPAIHRHVRRQQRLGQRPETAALTRSPTCTSGRTDHSSTATRTTAWGCSERWAARARSATSPSRGWTSTTTRPGPMRPPTSASA